MKTSTSFGSTGHHHVSGRVKTRDRAASEPGAQGTPLRAIPGIGPAMERDLRDLGYSVSEDLRGEDPEAMYRALCRRRGARLDRCVLYVFRCAVYFASREIHDPELLKWWRWRDRPRGAA